MKVVDIADEVYRELSSPSDLSIAPISYWLRANIGKLNSALNRDYFIDDMTLEILEEDINHPGTFFEFGEDEKAILKMIYFVHFFDIEIRKQALTFNVRRAIEISTNGHTVRLASPTEVGKHFYSMRKTYADDLKQWIMWYRIAKAKPVQVTGDDTVEGSNDTSRPIYNRIYDV